MDERRGAEAVDDSLYGAPRIARRPGRGQGPIYRFIGKEDDPLSGAVAPLLGGRYRLTTRRPVNVCQLAAGTSWGEVLRPRKADPNAVQR